MSASGPTERTSGFPAPPGYAACASPVPPGRFVETGALVGPAWVRGLNQKAQIQTFAPGVVSAWFLFQSDTRAWFNKGVDPTV